MRRILKTIIFCGLSLMICLGIGLTAKPLQTQTAYALTYKQGSSGQTIKKIQQKLKNFNWFFRSVLKQSDAPKWFVPKWLRPLR